MASNLVASCYMTVPVASLLPGTIMWEDVTHILHLGGAATHLVTV